MEPTSRLCLKITPVTLTEASLREKLLRETRGSGNSKLLDLSLTDLKIARTHQGKSRQLAFVGFKTAEQCAAAQKYWDRSYIGTHRVSAEFARPPGDGDIARPWSRHSVGASANPLTRERNEREKAERLARERAEALAGFALPSARATAGAGAATSAAAADGDKPGRGGRLTKAEEAEARARRRRLDALSYHPALIALSAEQRARVLQDQRFLDFMDLTASRRAQSKTFWDNSDQSTATATLRALVLAKQVDEQGVARATGETYEALMSGLKEGKGTAQDKKAAKRRGDDDSSDDDDYFENPAVSAAVRRAEGGDGDDDDSDDEEQGSAPGAGEKDGEVSAFVSKLLASQPANRAGLSDADYFKMKQGESFDTDSEAEAEDEDEDEDEGEEDASLRGRAKRRRAAAGSDSDDEDSKVSQASKRARVPAAAHRRGSDNDDEDDDTEEEEEEEEEDESSSKPAIAARADDGSADDDGDVGDVAPRAAATGVPRDLTPAQAEAMILKSGRLFLRSLPFSVTEAELRTALDAFGDVTDLSLPLDLQRQSKGFATAAFAEPAQALAAYQALNGRLFQGRVVHLLPAVAPPARTGAGVDPLDPFAGLGDDELKKMTHKRKTELLARARAQQGHNWNSLFISQNTVAEAVAAKFKLAKADLLGADAAGEDASIGVRMAVAETHIIQETKQYLEECGVNLEAFQSTPGAAAAGGAKRSVTAILVKNLPYSAEDAELRKLFKKFGPLVRFILPPYKTMAVVEFADSAAAKKAFLGLAYKKYQTTPLYLEWAPADALRPMTAEMAAASGAIVALTADGAATTNVSAARADQERAAAAALKRAETGSLMAGGSAAAGSSGSSSGSGSGSAREPESEAEEAPEDVDGRSIYVKNVSFDTKEGDFKAAMGKLLASAWTAHCAALHRRGKQPPAAPWAVRAVRIAHRTATGADKGRELGEKLSLGYGFVELSTGAAAAAVLAAAAEQRGVALDGHLLELRISRRGEASGLAAGKRSAGDISGAAQKTILRERGVVTEEKAREQEEWSQRSAKLIVRNVPFEANVKEIRELFSAFGQLKRCRMPVKADKSSHRGFAFVDFVTAQEARNAFGALQSTHLLGRHLVLEWANPDETVEELREKTRKQQEARGQAALSKLAGQTQRRPV
jgi:multiple RNA-binding domain-containing protein 1